MSAKICTKQLHCCMKPVRVHDAMHPPMLLLRPTYSSWYPVGNSVQLKMHGKNKNSTTCHVHRRVVLIIEFVASMAFRCEISPLFMSWEASCCQKSQIGSTVIAWRNVTPVASTRSSSICDDTAVSAVRQSLSVCVVECDYSVAHGEPLVLETRCVRSWIISIQSLV